MQLTRVVILLAVVAPLLAAQQDARPPRAGTLEAEVHYATGGDAWFSTNKPAYVALFDVSRDGVSQLYPTFSAQAAELSGTSVRVEMRVPTFAGRSSLVSLNASGPGAGSAWPHTLLLVASTMPLRVGSSWASNIAINNDLVRQHHWNDLDSDAGINAVVDMVRPNDWGAEVAIDRAALATPARYTSSLAFDPARAAVTYSCVDASRTFLSPTPLLGANCVGLREFPSTGPTNAAVVASRAGPTVDTVRTPAATRVPATNAGTTRISEKKNADVRSISDPAEIRKFMEKMQSRQADAADPRHDHPRDGVPSSDRAAGNRPGADGSSGYHGNGAPAAHADQAREAHQRADGPRSDSPRSDRPHADSPHVDGRHADGPHADGRNASTPPAAVPRAAIAPPPTPPPAPPPIKPQDER